MSRPTAALRDKQRFYWLHAAEASSEATTEDDGVGATDLIADSHGYLYVATRLGVQVCDRNGARSGHPDAARRTRHPSLLGRRMHSEYLYVVCGGHLYRRQMRTTGIPGWAEPVSLPDFGSG